MTEPTDPLEGLIEPTEPEDHSPLEKPGNKIGPYRLLQVLGSGGMGEVWLAERREPYVQRVALKVVKPGMDTKAVLSRFEQERQVLAQMNHPNIAKVLDAGVNEQGRPYFVMEYVPGKPITEFADEQKLSIQARLEYFLQVCNAIAHAHQKGVIHRDIKPGNILVSRGEIGEVGTGSSITAGSSIKVIDFGVAKAMAGSMTDQTVYTQIGHGIGTWGYMSPEQIEGDTQPPSDVYSLGVLLYELVCGEKPYEVSNLRNLSPKERADFIRGVDVISPSRKLKEARGRYASRNITSASQIKRLRELDWVCVKALCPEMSERFLTVRAFAEDVQKFVSGEQVAAAPVSTGFRLQRFWRRNSTAVVGVVVAALVLYSASFFMQKTANEREELEQRSEELEQELDWTEDLMIDAVVDLAMQQLELTNSKEEIFVKELSLALSTSRTQPVHSGVQGDRLEISQELQAGRSLIGKGVAQISSINGQYLRVLEISESGLWVLVQLLDDNLSSFAIVQMQNGAIKVASELPKSFFIDESGSYLDADYIISEDTSGIVWVVIPSDDRIRIARYDPEYGPVESENILDLKINNRDLEYLWYSRGALLARDLTRQSQLVILDLETVWIKQSTDSLVDFIETGEVEPDVESRKHIKIFRSQQGYVVASVKGEGASQALSLIDVLPGFNNPGTSNASVASSVFDLPEDFYGDVVEVRVSTNAEEMYIESTLNGATKLFVLRLQTPVVSGERTTVELGHSCDLQWHRPLLATAGAYCEPKSTDSSRVYSFSLRSGAAQPSGIDGPVFADEDSIFQGLSAAHLYFLKCPKEYSNTTIYSVPRPASTSVRVWSPYGISGQVPLDSGGAPEQCLRTLITETGRQALEFSAMPSSSISHADQRLQADHRLPIGELIRDYFVFEGVQFLVTLSASESVVRIYEVSDKELVLKADFLPGKSGMLPQVVCDVTRGKVFVLQESKDLTSKVRLGNLGYQYPLSFSEFSINDLGNATVTRTLRSFFDLTLELDSIRDMLVDHHSNLCCFFTSSELFCFSTQDSYFSPIEINLDLPSGWSFTGQPLAIPDSPYWISPITVPHGAGDGVKEGPSYQSHLGVFVVSSGVVDEGAMSNHPGGPEYSMYAHPTRCDLQFVQHVGIFDDISIEQDQMRDSQLQVSLAFWRKKDQENQSDPSDYFVPGLQILDPTMPWEPIDESAKKYTKLKWPLFLLQTGSSTPQPREPESDLLPNPKE